MTRKESDVLNQFLGEWKEYRANDTERNREINERIEKLAQRIEVYIDEDSAKGRELEKRMEALERLKNRILYINGIILTLLGLVFYTIRDWLVEHNPFNWFNPKNGL